MNEYEQVIDVDFAAIELRVLEFLNQEDPLRTHPLHATILDGAHQITTLGTITGRITH